ncbi:tRNA (adenosine(37)-N6)-dimethylallyltransferase MiaA [Candidatus Nitrospira bockiana]
MLSGKAEQIGEPSRDAKPLVVLLGPTAVGKSRMAIPVARALQTEILTADSRQVYCGMDIGMDKPREDERGGVPHRLLDLVQPDQPFNVGEYRRLALAEIRRLHREGRVPLMVGGTGLYIRAVVRGLWEGPPADWEYRRRLSDLARIEGPEHLHRRLAAIDPDLASRLHPRDEAKIIRGLEIYETTGRRLSDLHREHAFAERPFSTLLIGLVRDRSELYRRIDARVDEQIARGLVDETRRLLACGYSRNLGSMKGLGYRQMAGYLAGEYSFEEACRRLKRDTRHFAKRQMTWFRREPGVVWLMVAADEPAERTAERVLGVVRDRGAARMDDGPVGWATAVSA